MTKQFQKNLNLKLFCIDFENIVENLNIDWPNLCQLQTWSSIKYHETFRTALPYFKKW